jgi:hypothetical protein
MGISPRRLAAMAFVCALAPATARSEPTWAPAATAAIHPGVQTVSPSGQCTSNFVFFDAANDVYIGQAAHCTATGGATETNGCFAGSLPVGTAVEIQGASRPGVMVYNSWVTMQAIGETDPDACAYNDLAIVRIDPADAAKVNPSIPAWGGPMGIGPAVPEGELIYSYGNSSLRLGASQLSPKVGASLGPEGNGWSTAFYAVSPGVPGDSGSAVLDSRGRAVGVISTLVVAPAPGSNNAGSIQRELAYLNAHASLGGISLANGTVPFDGDPSILLLSLLR